MAGGQYCRQCSGVGALPAGRAVAPAQHAGRHRAKSGCDESALLAVCRRAPSSERRSAAERRRQGCAVPTIPHLAARPGAVMQALTRVARAVEDLPASPGRALARQPAGGVAALWQAVAVLIPILLACSGSAAAAAEP